MLATSGRLARKCPATHWRLRASPLLWQPLLPARGLAEAESDGHYHLRFSPSRQAIASSSTRTASSTAITGRTWNSKAGQVEQNL